MKIILTVSLAVFSLSSFAGESKVEDIAQCEISQESGKTSSEGLFSKRGKGAIIAIQEEVTTGTQYGTYHAFKILPLNLNIVLNHSGNEANVSKNNLTLFLDESDFEDAWDEGQGRSIPWFQWPGVYGEDYKIKVDLKNKKGSMNFTSKEASVLKLSYKAELVNCIDLRK